jgi:hypothetical protein
VGTRLLPEIPEQARGLSQGVLERGELDGSREELLISPLSQVRRLVFETLKTNRADGRSSTSARFWFRQ